MTDKIIDRITYLDRERLDITEAIKKASDIQVLRWLVRRKKRNERTVEVFYELLGAKEYEKV